MKTIKDDRKRRTHFESITENYIAGNCADAKIQVNNLSKIDLIRFVNFLHFFGYRLYIDVCGSGLLDLFETH